MSARIFRLLFGALALQVLFAADFARAQTPAPETVAAARELVETMHLSDQYNTVIPSLFKVLKPALVQGRADVEREYDALTPMLIEVLRQRVSEMSDMAATVYAKNFSADDLHALNDFYKTPAGQRLREKTPAISAEMLVAGMKFGKSISEDVKQRMTDELRKKGISL